MQPKISIVVPVYNTGVYIEKCLSSLLIQTFDQIEILCVDKHLKFRVNRLMRSGISDELIEMHLKKIAYLKWSFLEYSGIIDAMDIAELKKLIIKDSTLQDVMNFAEIANNSEAA